MEFPTLAEVANPGITAIVGPNGSGKSNVADAVRWVLGEQSIKLLRGKRAEDVIFFGSKTKARLGFAEVSIYLNNKDKTANIDYDQIVVKRAVYRSGESEYYINNAKTRLSDIQLLLAQANFGQRTYSVIGQGMVDSILSSTAHERKNFFDEATGVKQHQIKREQAIDKIKKTEENLSQASSLLKEITPRLRSLEKQVKKLEKREALEERLKEMQINYYGNLWNKITRDLERLRGEKRAVSERHLSITKKMSELSLKMQKIEKKQKNKSQNSDYDNLQKEYFNSMVKKNDLSAELGALKRELEIITIQGKKNKPINYNELEKTSIEGTKFFDSFLASKTTDEFLLLKEQAKNLKKKILYILSGTKEEPKEEIEKIKSIKEKIFSLEKEISSSAAQAEEKQKEISSKRKSESKAAIVLIEIQKNYQAMQADLNKITNGKNIIAVDEARVETKKYDLAEEIKKETDPQTREKIENSKETGGQEIIEWESIARVKNELERIGGIDKEINKEYEETKSRHDFLSSQTRDLSDALEKTKKALKHLDEIIDKEFNKSFDKIKIGFEEYFKFIFNGGRATIEMKKQSELESLKQEILEGLSDEERQQLSKQFKIGIEISACPPGKKISSINTLSGGEKALTSIALICAIIKSNPSPFVVLDEVDAALDEANSERFAQILSRLSEHTQFIAITHNRATMEKANILYGVTMDEEGISKLLSIDLEKAMEEIKDN